MIYLVQVPILTVTLLAMFKLVLRMEIFGWFRERRKIEQTGNCPRCGAGIMKFSDHHLGDLRDYYFCTCGLKNGPYIDSFNWGAADTATRILQGEGGRSRSSNDQKLFFMARRRGGGKVK